jgi:hypothetical protein
MKKRIGRRLVSLLLTVVTILTMLPAMTLPALAAQSGTVVGLADENIGLSFTGDAEDAWSANTDRIVGRVTSYKGGTWLRYESTLIIKNNKNTLATLSFDYAIEQNEGTIIVDGVSVTAGGTVSKELQPGDSIEVYIKSAKNEDGTTITMTNVKLVADATATVTFQPAENGSYTVDGKTITEPYTHDQSSMTAYQLAATPAEGYVFRDWYNVTTGKTISKEISCALNVEEDCTITARFLSQDSALFEVGSKTFFDLGAAVEHAINSNASKITLIQSGSLLDGEYTIPKGITLLIPFDEAGTLYTDTPDYVNKYEPQSVFKKLTIPSGSSITVNGAISVGGKHFAGSSGSCCRTSGPYGQIDMAAGSSITLNSGANLYAWGYITGDGEITATSGSIVYEYFQLTDWRGGTATNKMNQNKQKVFPFSQYYVQNIEAALTIQAGAQEIAHISIEGAGMTKSASINFIGNSKSLFRIYDGTLTKKYDPKTDRITYTTTGSASLDSLSLKVSVYTFDSKDYVLPVNSNMTLEILSGSVAVNSDAALLPGAQITIAQGAELSVSTNKSLYVYERDQWKAPYVYGSKESGFVPVPYTPTTKGSRTLADAKIDVNGTLTAAGGVYTTQSGADICSSEGTGKFVQQSVPGTAPFTHQVSKQENKKFLGIPYAEITYADIPITAAKLKNASVDKPYTETSTAKAGETFTYCKCQDCGGGTWVKNLQAAAIIDSNGTPTEYPTLQAAVNKFSQNSSGTTYIKLLHNTTEDINNITRDIYLDLNGRTVTGDISVSGAYKLYGMDSSAKADYTTAPTGKIVGTVTGCAPTYETPPVKVGDVDTYDRYVAISGLEADGKTANLSFHHFNISVTGYRFELATGDTPQCALFFIGKFRGDDAAKKYLTKLGFTLKYIADESQDFSYPMPGSLNNEVGLDEEGAYLFEAYLMCSFDKNDAAAYQTKISATAQAIFGTNVGTQNSKTKQWSFEDAWTEPEGYKNLTPKQQEILNRLLTELDIPIPK